MAGMHAWKCGSDEERQTSRVKTLLTSFIYSTENDFAKTNPADRSKLTKEIKPDEVKPSDGALEHTSFITRLETYTRWPWLGKPQQLSPVCCARLGWQCLQQDMLQCVTCGAFMSVHLPHVTQPAVYDACVQRVEENLRTAHKAHCTWTLVPTPASVICAEWTRGDQAVRSFVDRLSTCKKLQGNMPDISEDTKRTMGIPEASLAAVASLDTGDGDGGNETSPSQQDSAVTCALLGWTANDSSSTLRCKYCQREIGTWNFMPRTLDRGSSPSPGAAGEVTQFVFDNYHDYAPNVHSEESGRVTIESRMKVESNNTHDANQTKQENSHLPSRTSDKCIESTLESGSCEHNDGDVEDNITNDREVEADVETDGEVEVYVDNDVEVEANVRNDEEVESDVENDGEVKADVDNDVEVKADVKKNEEVEESSKNDEKVEADVENDGEVKADFDNDMEVGADVKDEVEEDVENDGEVVTGVENDRELDADVGDDIPRTSEKDENVESKNMSIEHDDVMEEQVSKPQTIGCIPEIIITQPEEDEVQKTNCCIPEIIISQPDTDEECSRETSSTSYTDKSEEDNSSKTSSEDSGPGYLSHKRKLPEEESDCTEAGDESDGQASTCSMQNTKILLKARIKRKRAECLDAMGEHHVWCPWVAASTFSLPGGATESIPPGWTQLLETLLKQVHLRDNPGRQVIQGAKQLPLLENVHKIRQHMRNWKSPALSRQKADSIA